MPKMVTAISEMFTHLILQDRVIIIEKFMTAEKWSAPKIVHNNSV